MNEREKNYVEVDILELLKSVWHYKFIVISFVMVATILSDINDTELISVEITTNSAYDSYKLVKSLLELAPDTLMKVSKGGSIEILDNAELPSKPNDKGLVKKIILAAFVGGVLAVGLIFMLTFFDNKIHKSEDIEKRYDVSILGVLDN